VLLLAFDTATPAVTVARHDEVIAEEPAVHARQRGELPDVIARRGAP
jgi:hypothetical protein